MKKKIGIPKALLYYNYHTIYETFFQEIGAEVILSNPTMQALEKGSRLVPDEVCLPIKNYFGHIIDLKEKKVDCIFVPRFMRVEKHTTFCPKIISLPDLIRNIIPDLPHVIAPDVDFSKRLLLYKNIRNIGRYFDSGFVRSLMAWRFALKKHHTYRNSLTGDLKRLENNDQFNIAVVGHPYNIYDSNLNLNLFNKLRDRGVYIYTPDMIPQMEIEREADDLPKKIFWTLSRDIVGASKYFIKQPKIHGIINIASFACGPDSIMGELISFLVREYSRKPYLLLVLDEHTGSAGLETRLEAFIEMIRMMRNK